ncbi:ABC transporter substrate-binding protein [Celeribacter neptunius]|uniref:NitT/TauT family transport system substrate-binding protein n=1 Tax=Celeribacter neptunius TaxID=588602 RepID=A0A1I3UGD0_9RHOB|nr:ABC transporter substrate-binding protein [Celeribacter neptunius]SFJ81982.1 NitT/TauT family transport system substrate-binding protein [Celeribacter neptunius]
MTRFTKGLMALTAAASLTGLIAGSAQAEDLPTLKAALYMSGTVAWEVETIKQNQFDQAHGFELETMDVAGSPASRVALAAGEVDMIVADWLWVAAQRASGKDYVFVPYSKAVGGLYVPEDSPAQSLADLKGGKIGIAGGPNDKSWLILRAYAEQATGQDLAGDTEQVFGAPPLIFKSALSGELDGAINFWHFGAKMEAAGMRLLASTSEAAVALGLNPDTPLLGYVMRGEVVRDHPELVEGLIAASREAKDLLASDDAAWEQLRDRMRVKNDAQFEALKAGWIAGIPAPGPVSEEDAAKMLAIMASLGGEALVGKATSLPEGLFYKPAS